MSTKRGLARNPLELVLGRGRPEMDSTPEPVAPIVEADATPAEAPTFHEPLLSEVEPASQRTPAPSVRKARPAKRRSRPMAADPNNVVQSPEAVRVGTIKRPYLRIDGIAMRQVSLSLPVDLMQQANICAIKQGLRSNEIVQLALENYLQEHGE